MALLIVVTGISTPIREATTDGSVLLPFSDFLSEQATDVLGVVVENIVNEAKTGTSEGQEVVDVIANLPVHENDSEISDHAEVTINPVHKAFNTVLNKIVLSVLPEGLIRNFLNNITGGMHDFYIYLTPVNGEDGVYYINTNHINDNGEATHIFTGIKFEKSTGKLYGQDNNGLMGIGFDYDVKNYTITTPVNVWMRGVGYNIFYDIFGGMGFMNTDTVRVKFDHDGKQWMFQFWKGNYGFNHLNGAELGIYNKTDKYAFGYNCASDEEMLVMSTTLRTEDEVLIERDEMRHWWMCGFRFGPPIEKASLIMESTVQFEDEGMMNAFLESAKEFSDEMTVSADGMKVSIIWQ